jgi:hypothetical protein
VNAGHPSGYLLRDGSAGALPSGGPPLGLLPTTVSEAMRAQGDDSLARRSPTEICDHLLRAAGRGPGL